MSAGAYAGMTGRENRELCRAGAFDRPTAGVALGFTQANLVVIDSAAAPDFERFCRLNPRPCPLLEVTRAGQYEPISMAPGADLRRDLPRYRVYRNGILTDRPTSLEPIWNDNLVAFLIGCSFTFEAALLEAGVPLRHVEQARNVPMYRTNLPCTPAGEFSAPLVVSMRPLKPEHVRVATEITSAFDRVHGSPVHVGDPGALGIRDLNQPDYGDAVTIHPGEMPVFWACGVTPLEAIMRAKPDLAITHEPGHMFVTDVKDRDLRNPAPWNLSQ